MNKQPGFSVIELTISIMISAFLMTAALTIYHQISKGLTKMQFLTTQDTTVAIVKHRLSIDLQGLSPLWFSDDQYEELKTTAKESQSNSTPKTTPATTKKSPEADPNNPSNGYLFAQSNNNQFQLLTFVTTNALPGYPCTPYRCVRVVYVLKQDPHHNNFFLLQRKEEHAISTKLNLEKLTQGHFYTIAKNITNCTIEYGFIDIPPDKRNQQSNQAWKMKWVHSWGQPTDEKKEEDYIPTLPDLIKLKITLQENTERPSQEHEICCLLPISNQVTFQSFAQQRIKSPKSIPSPTNNIIANSTIASTPQPSQPT